MFDYAVIGSTPVSEDCAQVGAEDYGPRAKAEIRAFQNQLIRLFGEPPFGAYFKKKAFSHDFGTYHELCVVYDAEIPEAEEYAYRCESEAPEFWDAEALAELESAGFPPRQAERA
jgi:hypothetical protein